jgi:hypothetical protein
MATFTFRLLDNECSKGESVSHQRIRKATKTKTQREALKQLIADIVEQAAPQVISVITL